VSQGGRAGARRARAVVEGHRQDLRSAPRAGGPEARSWSGVPVGAPRPQPAAGIAGRRPEPRRARDPRARHGQPPGWRESIEAARDQWLGEHHSFGQRRRRRRRRRDRPSRARGMGDRCVRSAQRRRASDLEEASTGARLRSDAAPGAAQVGASGTYEGREAHLRCADRGRPDAARANPRRDAPGAPCERR